MDLIASLRLAIRGLHGQGSKLLGAKVIIVLTLPKTRLDGGDVESNEVRAVLTGASLTQIGVALGVLDVTGGVAGALIGEPCADNAKLQAIDTLTVQPLCFHSEKSAANLNGRQHSNKKVVGVGYGALGSHVINNLVRGGFGRWTLIDDDLFLPHNSVRHTLPAAASGINKAKAGGIFLNEIFEGQGTARAIPANLLRPGKHTEEVASALGASDLVVDLAASVAVSRHLARTDDAARVISSFISPNAKALVVAAEDEARSVRQDWLEVIHYRAILQHEELSIALQDDEGMVRYGNGCRDVTSRLPQDQVAIFSGLASRRIHEVSESDEASLWIWSDGEEGIKLFKKECQPPTEILLAGWTLRFDEYIVQRLEQLRAAKLPNETGGVLIGTFDMATRQCNIVEVLSSPPDSSEWPTSYIRGCEGLQEEVEKASAATLGQVTYIGEWHSHPDGCSIEPSGLDRKAWEWLDDHMRMDGLPSIMLIVGEQRQLGLVQTGS